MQKINMVSLFPVLGGSLIGVMIALSSWKILEARLIATKATPVVGISEKEVYQSNSVVWGNAKAPYKIIEFMDYQCPPCRSVHKLEEKMFSGLEDKIALCVHNMPLPFHAQAKMAAYAATAAREQGRFPQMHKLLIEDPNLSPKTINEAAASLKLDMEQFHKTLDTTAKESVEADMVLAQKLKVNATPSFFICQPNGTILKVRSMQDIRLFVQ